MKRPVVAAIGEMLWDVYPDGAHFGGAPANFASHAAILGAESWMVSAVGLDSLGDKALRVLSNLRVRCDTVRRHPNHPTGQVLVSLDRQGVPKYEIASDCAWDHLAWSDDLAAFAERCDAVCFGSLAQRSPDSRATIRRFAETVPRAALRMFDVNLRQSFFDRDTIDTSLRLASAVKLNDEELPVVASLLGIGGREPRDVMRKIMDAYDLRLGALTRGAAGALLLDDRNEDDSPAPATVVVNTVGAGDAFTASVVVDFLRGLALAEINRSANAIASQVCSQPAATPALLA